MTAQPTDMPIHKTAVIIVDHGSRREESNQMLLQVVAQFRAVSQYAIIEPAHMEIAAPSIADAFGRCVEQGAKLVIVHPYLLSPGRHWKQDIPAQVADAAKQYTAVQYLVTAPLGAHPLISQVIQQRIDTCLHNASVGGEGCDVCADDQSCKLLPRSTAVKTKTTPQT